MWGEYIHVVALSTRTNLSLGVVRHCDSVMVCTCSTRDLTLCMRQAHLCAHVNTPALRDGHIYVPSDLVRNIGCVLKK